MSDENDIQKQIEELGIQSTPVDLNDIANKVLPNIAIPTVTDTTAPSPVVEEPVVTDDVVDFSSVDNKGTKPAEPGSNETTSTAKDSNEPIQHKKVHVQYKYSYTTPKWNKDAVIVDLPSATIDNTEKVLEKLPNLGLSTDEDSVEWLESIQASVDNISYDKQYTSTLDDANSNFSQDVNVRGNKLKAKELKTNFSNQKLTGEKAIIAFNKTLGMGDLIQIPLYHSGFWITLKTPSEMDMIRLNRQITDDKIRLGRNTQGLAFSNLMSYTVSKLTQFALDHIFDTTLQVSALENKDIKDLIKCEDYNILIWGILCSMYPRGFQYRRPCLNDPEKCNYTLKETINLFELQWTNNSALTDSHKNHMTSRIHKTMSLDSVENYQKTLPAIGDKVITINDIRVTLKVPSLMEYVRSGEKWVTGITSLVEDLMQSSSDSNDITKKNTLIERHAQATTLRQVAHWIKAIEFSDKVVDDEETIDLLLDSISQNDDIRKFILDEIFKYIDESTISVIGIPNYNCPSCNMTQQDDDGSEFGNIIPMDMTSVFFDQHVQRMQIIARR